MKPRIGIIPGDPGGIGPELIAKHLHAAIPAELLVTALGKRNLPITGTCLAVLIGPLNASTVNRCAAKTGTLKGAF